MESRRPKLVAVRSGVALGLTLLVAACGPSADGGRPAREADALGAAVARLAASQPSDTDEGSGTARLIAPLSGSIAGSARPTLSWTGLDRVVIQLCADRACAEVLTAFPAVGGTARPPRPISPGVVFWRALAVGHGRSSHATPAWELFVPAGEADSPRATRGLRYDADADGFVDAAVRAQDDLLATDVLHVFAGGAGGLDPARDVVLTLDTTRFGIPLSAAGDMNGDGFGDLAVIDGRGLVVYAGSESGPVTTPLAALPPPPDANPYLYGFELSGAGDVNGDGYADVVVADGFEQVWVFLGGPSGPSSTPAWELDRRNTPGRFVRLLTTGDLNGDGFGDLVLIDYGSDGTPQGFRFFRGGPEGLEAPSAGTLVEWPGFPTGASGDVDGDGISDLVIADGASLTLLRGGSAFPSAAPAQVVPVSIRPGPLQLGDFDGDGAFDLAATTSTGTSSFYFTNDRIDVYRGGPNGLATTPTSTVLELSVLANNQLNFGLTLGNGDFDCDGREDLLVGAPPPFPTPFFETSPSAVFVFPGNAGGLGPTPTPRLDGPPGFGARVSAGAPQSGP